MTHKPILRFLIVVVAFTAFTTVQAQLVNGSFESQDSIADLSGWVYTCGSADSLADAPASGGKWCLKIASGNTQSCFPGHVIQTLPQADSGEIWRLEGWARTDTFMKPWATVGIYLARIDSMGAIHLMKGDTTRDSSWQMLSVTDTLNLGTGDTLAVILDPGLTGGPALGLAYFDALSLDSLGVAASIFQHKQLDWINLDIVPHPLGDEGHILLALDRHSWLNMELFDLGGNLLRTLAQGTYSPGSHRFHIRTTGLAPGMYILYLHTPEGIRSRRMLVTN